MPLLQAELWLPASLEEVWEFHKDPKNLSKISPEFLKLSLKNVPAVMTAGASFSISSNNSWLKPFLNWKVQYEQWTEDPDYKCFVDVQSEGPFKIWHHQHEFVRGKTELDVNGKKVKPKEPGMWIKDTLNYELKTNFKAASFVAGTVLERVFVFRKKRLVKLFGEVESPQSKKRSTS